MAGAIPTLWGPGMDHTDKTTEKRMQKPDQLRQCLVELEASEAKWRVLEEALQESGMRFRSVVESTVDAIISSDAEDRITFWNNGAKNIFGYSEEEVLGKPVTMLMPERYRESHSRGVQRYLATGEPRIMGATAELYGLRKGNIEFPVELSLSTWRTKEKIFFSAIIRDTSDRKQAEKALEQRTLEARQRTEELESLIHMVAHDLKSPVIAVAGLVRLLKTKIDELAPNPKIEQMLKQITSAAESMEKFLKDLLDAMALTHGEPEFTHFRMDEIVEDLVRQHKQATTERGIRILVDVGKSVPPIIADKHRIYQVLDNLLGNAIRHMGEKSDAEIRIQVADGEDCICTSVCDNGIGIPREYQNRIFDRFFRVPGYPGGKTGTGLGLSIVKKIVEVHKGKVWVESEPGKGAKFMFSLPKMPPG